MKTIKLLTVLALTALIGFTSCQSEENEQVGENPNANTPNSVTAKKYKRSGMNDGSKDDFLDGNSCAELLFPLTVTINGQEITLVSNLDLELAIDIMNEFNDDKDIVSFNFPIKVRLSNYTEVEITSQSELEDLNDKCEDASDDLEEAISCAKIDFPISILTYNVNLEQTGTVVVQSEKQLYTFVDDLDSNELFEVKYPITVTLNNGTSVQINNDDDFEDAVEECTAYEEAEDAAEESADELESFISKSTFKIESYVVSGVEKAEDFADYAIEFSNDSKLIVKNTVNGTTESIEGEYEVESELDVYVELEFEGNAMFEALNNEWIVTTYSNTVITLQSKTNAAITLQFVKI